MSHLSAFKTSWLVCESLSLLVESSGFFSPQLGTRTISQVSTFLFSKFSPRGTWVTQGTLEGTPRVWMGGGRVCGLHLKSDSTLSLSGGQGVVRGLCTSLPSSALTEQVTRSNLCWASILHTSLALLTTNFVFESTLTELG